MQTAKENYRGALAAVKGWINKERGKFGTGVLMEKMRAKLQGHFNYYGVSGNYDKVQSFYHEACGIVFKWLNRRSERKSFTWIGYEEMLKYFRIPRPRIIGYWD